MLGNLVAANCEHDAAAPFCEEQPSLTSRVAATDDHNWRLRAQTRFQFSGGVVDALAFELLQAGDIEAPVLRTAGDDGGAGNYLRPVGELNDKVPGVFAKFGGGAWTGHVGAEILRLHQCSPGQVAARDPGRKAEVI